MFKVRARKTIFFTTVLVITVIFIYALDKSINKQVWFNVRNGNIYLVTCIYDVPVKKVKIFNSISKEVSSLNIDFNEPVIVKYCVSRQFIGKARVSSDEEIIVFHILTLVKFKDDYSPEEYKRKLIELVTELHDGFGPRTSVTN